MAIAEVFIGKIVLGGGVEEGRDLHDGMFTLLGLLFI